MKFFIPGERRTRVTDVMKHNRPSTIVNTGRLWL